MEHQNSHSKIRKRGAEIVRSLISEGYQLVWQSNGCESACLKHRSNHNVIDVQCRKLGVYVYKNGKCIKIDLI